MQWGTVLKTDNFFHELVSGSILKGLDEQLSQQTEDILPYYYKNSQQNDHDHYHYDNYDYLTYEHDYTEEYLSYIILFLIILSLICFIILIVVCVKCCCCDNTTTVVQIPQQNALPANVPPAFAYVIPFSMSQGMTRHDIFQKCRKTANSSTKVHENTTISMFWHRFALMMIRF